MPFASPPPLPEAGGAGGFGWTGIKSPSTMLTCTDSRSGATLAPRRHKLRWCTVQTGALLPSGARRAPSMNGVACPSSHLRLFLEHVSRTPTTGRD